LIEFFAFVVSRVESARYVPGDDVLADEPGSQSQLVDYRPMTNDQ